MCPFDSSFDPAWSFAGLAFESAHSNIDKNGVSRVSPSYLSISDIGRTNNNMDFFLWHDFPDSWGFQQGDFPLAFNT
jgi:hypothetical protein